MNIIYYWPNTGKKEEKPYTGADITKPLVNLNRVKADGKFYDIPKTHEDYIFLYFVNEIREEITNFDKYRHELQPDELTTKKHSEYKHLLICNRVWKAIEIPQNEVIENLNTVYGQYLDEQYPQIVRQNHIIEKLMGANDERIKYIESLQLWLMDCKTDRELRIKKYIEEGVFPSFTDFIVKP